MGSVSQIQERIDFLLEMSKLKSLVQIRIPDGTPNIGSIVIRK